MLTVAVYLNHVLLIRSVIPCRGDGLGQVLGGQEHGRAQVQRLEDVLASISLVVALVQSVSINKGCGMAYDTYSGAPRVQMFVQEGRKSHTAIRPVSSALLPSTYIIVIMLERSYISLNITRVTRPTLNRCRFVWCP